MFNLPFEFGVGLSFVLGALFGSFSNVIILRWPQGESFVTPGSHCVQCKKPVRWFDNIPIFSYFVLRGKCRACGAPFSSRYAMIEFLMGIMFVFTFFKFHDQWFLIESWIFVFGLVTISFIDLDHFLIPDLFSLSGIVIGLIGGLVNPDRIFIDSFYGVLLGGGFLWAIAWVYYLVRKQEGLGGGDIKLLAWIGAVLGWGSVPFVILVSSVFGSLVGLTLAIRTKGGIKTIIPYGPFLALSALVYMFFGRELSGWYLQMFFPWVEP
ncbi:MAG: prepilin peptidase [Bdellovibrionales bacterium]|nr:prepilin peptidase [Bdellovibrionales bacterium]